MTCLLMTLGEMLKLALGTTTPDHINIAILHSFLKIVIEKLDFQSDCVEIIGPEASELRQMLCQARNPIINFKSCNDDYCVGETCYKSEKAANMEEQITRLTGIVEKMEADLKAHLEAIERCKLPTAAGRINLKRSRKNYIADEESFSSDCEDLCVPCDEGNLIACDLLQNQPFLKKLMRRVTSPIIDRIFEFEKLIGMLNEKFQNFLNTAEDEYRKIPLIEDCLRQVEVLRQELAQHKLEFIATMEEIQEMLDSKLDKLHIPPLKKYIKDRMDQIENKLDALVKREECPKAAGVIMTSMQCLCCTNRVCQKDRVYTVPLLPHVTHTEIPKMLPRQFRSCIPHDKVRPCGGDHTVIRPGERSLKKLNLIDQFGDKIKLHLSMDNADYFKGLDGGMYRLAPEKKPC